MAQPAGVTVAFVFLLDRVGAAPIPGVPYASFVFPAMLCWLLFASGVTGAVNGLAGSMSIVAKVRFNRLVPPVSGALLPLVDFILASAFLPVLLVVQGSGRRPDALGLLGAVAGIVVLAVGVGCFVGALAVFVRDLRNALPFVLQLLLLAAPVIYPAERLPEAVQISPVVTFVSLFRSSLVDVAGPTGFQVARALLISVLVLVAGVAYFRSVEDRFADVA